MSSPSPSRRLNVVSTALRSSPAGWDGTVPLQLRPLARAYLLGYGLTVGPRVFSLILSHALRLLLPRDKDRDHVADATATAAAAASTQRRDRPSLLRSLARTLRAGLAWHRFPAFCAAIVGGSTLLEPVLQNAFARVAKDISSSSRIRVSRWLSSFVAAWFSVQLLQFPPSSSARASRANSSDQNPKPQAGRTMDLTLFAATRALDVIIGELWSRRLTHLPRARSKVTRNMDRLASNIADTIVFSLSCAIIMWNWFYSPDSLPHTYTRWITSAASVDQRLIIALQRCRSGIIRYGEDTGQAPLLQEMCAEYGWPPAWGDPAVSVPFPCELVHMGAGASCEVHALSRFARAWLWSLKMYLPLQLVMLIPRAPKSKNLKRDVLRTLLSASRSSAFLGTFITLFYYGVCLARTRVGPHVLGNSVAARQRIDGGLCVGTGCFLCGWSVLVERASRQKELALFVAPRAVATLLPRRYDADKLWMERTVFAASTAVVFTCVLENKNRVRGALGSVLRMVLAA